MCAASANCACSAGHRPAESAVEQGRGEAIKRKTAAAFFDDQAGLFQKTQMPRHTRLRDAEHRRQLGDVQPPVFSGEHAQQAEPHFVAQEPVQLAGLFHIHEYTSMYIDNGKAAARWREL